ncbi:MAG TPA: MFS transporter [Thermomicrobiaceae bacterium]|nr:MFS transporter [Thermomicrobiaceae bacterium]
MTGAGTVPTRLPLLTLLVASAVSEFGSMLTLVALPWFVLQTTGSATDTGLTGFTVCCWCCCRSTCGLSTGGRATSAGWSGRWARARGGVLLYGTLGHRVPRRPLWIATLVVFAVPLGALVLRPPLPVLLALLALAGLCNGPINPLLVTVRHERIPPAHRGRVFSAFTAAAQLAVPLGMAVMGVVVGAVGLSISALVVAAAIFALGVGMVFVPSLRELGRPAASGSAMP